PPPVLLSFPTRRSSDLSAGSMRGGRLRARGRVPSTHVLSLAEVPTGVPKSRAPGRAFRLEPYSYPEVRALMDALGLAEPVAVTLDRKSTRLNSSHDQIS